MCVWFVPFRFAPPLLPPPPPLLSPPFSPPPPTVTYGVEPSLVERYNAIYGTAIMLPAENYELTQPTATIIAGAVESDDVVVTVKNLTSLDRNLVYVLPVTVVSSSVEVL